MALSPRATELECALNVPDWRNLRLLESRLFDEKPSFERYIKRHIGASVSPVEEDGDLNSGGRKIMWTLCWAYATYLVFALWLMLSGMLSPGGHLSILCSLVVILMMLGCTHSVIIGVGRMIGWRRCAQQPGVIELVNQLNHSLSIQYRLSSALNDNKATLDKALVDEMNSTIDVYITENQSLVEALCARVSELLPQQNMSVAETLIEAKSFLKNHT